MFQRKARRLGDLAFDSMIIGVVSVPVVLGAGMIPPIPGPTLISVPARFVIIGGSIMLSSMIGQMLADEAQERLFM